MATTPNRAYVYPDENTDGWYATFSALMNAIDADIGNAFVGSLVNDVTITKSTPAVRFNGQEAGATDFRIAESFGTLYIQKNTGSSSNPVWTSLLGFTNTGDILSLFSIATYSALKARAALNPTAWFFGFASDLGTVGQLVFYCGSVSVGDNGWFILAGA